MKNALILHNPGAGDEEYSDKDLVSLIEDNGFITSYFSLKDKNWKKISMEDDFLIITGGDGSIRKVIKELLKRQSDLDFPIALIPAGTANNISKSLEIVEEPADLIKNWHNRRIKKFDIGRLRNTFEPAFFLESLGYGLFPRLMKEMKKVPKELTDTPEKKIRKGLEMLQAITSSYEAAFATINIDGHEFTGNYLMVEMMNTPSIGPNLILAPEADPGDGTMEIVLINESHRDKMLSYIDGRIRGQEENLNATILTGEKVKIKWEGKDIHVDDELLEDKDYKEVNVEFYYKKLNFLVP
jgi:diacylglycerol kinase (ATP)